MSAEDARREYQSSLDDLTFNSKLHINMLTILAEENLQFNEDIVAIIEAQIVKKFSENNNLKMSAEVAREDTCRGYQLSLEYLTFNSKLHINMLTILAEENLPFIKDIVAIIEAQIAKAPPGQKLPVLYLVDSIVKNVGGQYLEVFTKNLITSFICVFEKVDENTRKCLFKLRSTWDEIFPLKKLHALDVRVNTIDPAWPIKALPPNVNTTIHVNPKFLKPTEELAPHPTVSNKNLAEEQVIRQQLLAKQKQLIELQQKVFNQDTKISKTYRKRSRSRSRSPPQHSPKRKRTLSSVSEQRSLKRPLEDRNPEHRDVQRQRASPLEHKNSKDIKRWRSGWEEKEKKPLKQPDPDLSHSKLGPQRHKVWNSYQRPPTPRAPKQHRLSVDANLQIPDVLNSASKRDLLRKASQRLANGELTQEAFLSVAHQIKQIFQYQEEKQRCDSWEGPNDDAFTRKKHPGHISSAELSYLEHKSKLRRTQLQSSHSQFKGPHGVMGQPRPEAPSRHHPPVRYDGHCPPRFEGHGRYNGLGPNRFERPPVLKTPERSENLSAARRPMSYMEPHGRFEGPGSGCFDNPMLPQGPARFDGPEPLRNNSPIQSNRFDGSTRFGNPHIQQGPPGGFEGPMLCPSGIVNYKGPRRVDGPGNQPGMMHIDNPAQPAPIRFEGQPTGMPRFHSASQGIPRYPGPLNMQNLFRPQGQMIIDQPQNQGPMLNPGIPPHNFHMRSVPFHLQQNISQGPNFNAPEPAPSGFQKSYRPFAPFLGAAPTSHPQNMPLTSAPVQNFGKTKPSAFQPNPEPYPVPFSPPGSQVAQPESHLGQMDVNDLMAKLIDFGIIQPAQTDSNSESASPTPSQSAPEEEDSEEEKNDDTFPDLTSFVVDDMKQRHESVITKLYTGIQCYSCGIRFTASNTDIYADHLDWHYRQNRKAKDITRKITHRQWYCSLTDWIEFEEIADLEERAKSQFFEKVHEEVVQKNQEAAKEREFQSVKAAADVVHESCEVCQEQFEMYWKEDLEEWHLKNAIRVDEKTYHPLCYEDDKKTSSFVDSTPSPNKMLTENSLNAFLKQEREGEGSCSSIKEEAAEGDTEAVMLKQEHQDESKEGLQLIAAISILKHAAALKPPFLMFT